MLSIRFDPKSDWWVSGTAFTRLFRTALKDGVIAARLEEWLEVADANGGLDVSQLPPDDADKLTAALLSTAEREVQRLQDAGTATEDGSYRISLEKLLTLVKPAV